MSSRPARQDPTPSPAPPVGGAPDARARTWRELLAEAEAELGSATEARWLVEEASGFAGGDLLTRLDSAVNARPGSYLSSMVARRRRGEPLQYVLGRWGFRSLDLMVDKRVLIPRPETEEVVEWALAELAATLETRPPGHRPVVADLGTGSGAIGLSLAVETQAEVWATDVSGDALDVARANLAGIGMWAATRVRLEQGSWWDALPGELRSHLDLVVSNPPYVAASEVLPSEVESHEPTLALRGGDDGLEAYRSLLGQAAGWLAPGGAMVLEIGDGQAEAVTALADAAGAVRTVVHRDLSGRQRGVVARW